MIDLIAHRAHSMKRKSSITGMLGALLIGGILGSIAGSLLAYFEPLAFLNQSKEIGFSTGRLDLSLFLVNFGFDLRLSIGAIVGVLTGFVVYKKV